MIGGGGEIGGGEGVGMFIVSNFVEQSRVSGKYEGNGGEV